MNSEDRNVISQFIHDFISWLKVRLKGEKVSFKIIRLENRFAAVLRNVDNANAQKNNTTNDGDVQYEYGRKKLDRKNKTVYNEFNTIAMQWANSSNVEQGEVKRLFDNNSKKWCLIIADENSDGGYYVLGTGTYEEVRAEYDRYIEEDANAFSEDIEAYKSFQGKYNSSMREHSEQRNGRQYSLGNRESGPKFAGTANAQYVRTNNQEKSSEAGLDNSAFSMPENDGNSYSFGDIDKGNKKRDNISRANKQGELINEFYYALDKSEWNLFYRKIAESGFLEKTDVGDRVAIAIGGKLLIADRQLRGTDAHDFQIVAAYQEENGDWYVTNEIADIINESEDVYDKSRIESTIIRLGKKIDETSIFNRYDREHGEFVNNTYKRANGSRSTTTDGGHRTRTYGEGISSPVKQNTQRINAGLDDSAFSMPENDDEVSYSFEDDVVDKTSSLAERVRLGEISQAEYLNELQQLMNEATEKYGAIPKGENPVVSNLSELNCGCSYPISNARQKL